MPRRRIAARRGWSGGSVGAGRVDNPTTFTANASHIRSQDDREALLGATAPDPRDGYQENAEWYAALVAGWARPAADALSRLIGPIPAGTAVDIASGTGSALAVLCDLGAERLLAVEPSRSMRAGLMTTIAADEDLLERTTVLPDPAPAALDDAPPPWSAVTMLNAIGHLADVDRLDLWARLGEHLADDGVLVLSLQPPAEVTALPWTDFGEVRIGERSLRTRGRTEILDEHHVLWTMEWTLADALGEIRDQRTSTYPWRVLDAGSLRAELTAVGLAPAGSLPDLGFHAFTRS